MTQLLSQYDDPAEFVRVLTVLLEKTGVPQAKLAYAAGMDRHRVNHYLRGRALPSLRTMLRLNAGLFAAMAEPTRRRRPRG